MAAPKSHTLAMRSEVSMTSKLFRSPCVMKRWWRYSTADDISRAFLRRTWMGGGRHLAQHLVQAAAAHPLHDVHGISSVLARGHHSDAVGVAHAGADGKLVDEFLEVALGEGALQGGLDGDQHAVQQPLLHATVSTRLRGETVGELHMISLNDFQADLGIEFGVGVDKSHDSEWVDGGDVRGRSSMRKSC